jgi:hypothetical protein
VARGEAVDGGGGGEEFIAFAGADATLVSEIGGGFVVEADAVGAAVGAKCTG